VCGVPMQCAARAALLVAALFTERELV